MKYIIILLMLASTAFAVEPDEMLDDPALEARARVVSKGLRCLVCLNENIDDSNAGLARDLRILVRDRITAGDSNEETTQYVVDRYGEFVLLKPSFSAGNYVLWFTGPLLLLFGGLGAVAFVRKRGKAAPVSELNADEEEKIARLLKD